MAHNAPWEELIVMSHMFYSILQRFVLECAGFACGMPRAARHTTNALWLRQLKIAVSQKAACREQSQMEGRRKGNAIQERSLASWSVLTFPLFATFMDMKIPD
jgi:hypothetical protein